MMNVLAIGLVLSSLLTAVVWSPSPPSPPPRHDDHREVIVKEGHRVVVVEYDKEADGSTKVLISPQDGDLKETGVEKLPERIFSGPRELVCDAYGKCKHKIASAIGKTKDMVTETAHGVSDIAHDVGERAKGAVNEAAEKIQQDGGEAKDKVSEKVTGEPLGKVKDSVAQGIGKAKEVAGDVIGTLKDGAVKAKNFDVVESPKRITEDITGNVTGLAEESYEHAKQGVEETVENVREAGQKTLGEILSKFKELTYDVLWYIVSRDKIDAMVGLIHMLGFSTAYGMCVWVTFVSSYILSRCLPRQQFGMVQSRIYPVYFKAMAYCVSAALLGYLLTGKGEILTSKMGMFQSSSLFSALLMVLSNLLILEPRATKLMYERMKIEKEEGRGVAVDGMADKGDARPAGPTNVAAERRDVLRLGEKLKRLNAYSSALNVSTLVVLTWHMAYMAQRVHATQR